jgi:uncharacterized membrane protein YtjA (UPF0391 family)
VSGPPPEENFLLRTRYINPQPYVTMLRWTLLFLVIAVIAGIFGFTGVAGTASDIARILFFVFLVLLIVSAIISAFKGRPPV